MRTAGDATNRLVIDNAGVTTIGTSSPVTVSAAGLLTVANTTSIGDSNVVGATSGALNVNGNITLYNGTENHLIFNSVGTGIPSFTTRSAGTKLYYFQQ